MIKQWLTLLFVFGNLILLDSQARLHAQTAPDKPAAEAPSKEPDPGVGANIPTPPNSGAGTNPAVGINPGTGTNPGTGNPADGINPGSGMNPGAGTNPATGVAPDTGAKTGTGTDGK